MEPLYKGREILFPACSICAPDGGECGECPHYGAFPLLAGVLIDACRIDRRWYFTVQTEGREVLGWTWFEDYGRTV